MIHVEFRDLEKAAKEAVDKADKETAKELTGLFHKHLRTSGLPELEVRKCSVVHNKNTGSFETRTTPEAERHSSGTTESPGTGAIFTFWNRVDPVALHKKHLLGSSKLLGLA